MNAGGYFSNDYATARKRFRDASRAAQWQLWSYPLQAKDPQGEALTIDVTVSPEEPANDALVLSSGLHGVEGFFGSAVQLAFLERWRNLQTPRPLRCVLIHALNPYGFAWLRRVNEDNVDLNRNLLLPGERYVGCPEGYRALDGFLNPKRPPARFEPMLLKSFLAIVRFGMPALKQAITAGQYEYPRGLFYGGSRAAESNRLLSAHFDRWLGGCERVIHLDFHSGLGRRATYKLLIDYPIDQAKRERMGQWFGNDAFEVSDASGVAYTATGNFGRWCFNRAGARDYIYAAAEFGTYSAQRVFAGLRAENQAHHWAAANSVQARHAKERLVELFCPRSTRWRQQVIDQALQLSDRAIRALATGSAPTRT